MSKGPLRVVAAPMGRSTLLTGTYHEGLAEIASRKVETSAHLVWYQRTRNIFAVCDRFSGCLPFQSSDYSGAPLLHGARWRVIDNDGERLVRSTPKRERCPFAARPGEFHGLRWGQIEHHAVFFQRQAQAGMSRRTLYRL